MTRLKLAAVSLAGAWVLASCSNGVAIDPPQAIDEAEDACIELSSELPDTVSGQLARETEPESASTAAWGSPAPIVLRCGVSQPVAATPSAEFIDIEGVVWLPEQVAEGYIFTSWGRVSNVEVTVPDDYLPDDNPLFDLAAAIKEAVPKA